ncbi:cyclase family protein [Sporichthya sp.]|uniref:cyclase family protein n=1 Tax=Sporichthya sp. TaxID=65475 RepID=UPI00184D1E4B|nr:cyclase family protein [Sporichthya sp.]MBA3743566.1 cyclase family protein [Sporichthya sp.]
MSVPRYGDLPVIEALGLPHAWDVWGREDNLGTLNHLTSARVAAAAAEIATGQRFALSLPSDLIDPPLFGRKPMTRDVFAGSRNEWDERFDSVYPQAASQWDGLLHVRAREHGFWTGYTGDPPDAGGRLGIEHWSHGITGRGVLLDIDALRRARDDWDPLTPEIVTAADLREAAAVQGVEVRAGDILCLRYGWGAAYRGLDAAGRIAMADTPTFAGLEGSAEVAEQLWNWNIAAVAADNPAIERAPGDPAVGSLHRRLLPLLGFALGELFDLDDLAAACRADGRWSFFLVGVPHRVPGSVASAANAVALR